MLLTNVLNETGMIPCARGHYTDRRRWRARARDPCSRSMFLQQITNTQQKHTRMW